LAPVCRFDPSRPEAYRNRRVLRSVLSRYVPSLPAQDKESEY
jgi:hypothetical protein